MFLILYRFVIRRHVSQKSLPLRSTYLSLSVSIATHILHCSYTYTGFLQTDFKIYKYILHSLIIILLAGR